MADYQSTSVSITFQSSTLSGVNGAILQTEVKAVDNGDLSGSFPFNSSVFFRVYKHNVNAYTIETTDGTTGSGGTGTDTVTEYVTFSDSTEGSLSYPATSITEFTPLGSGVNPGYSLSGNQIVLNSKQKMVAKVTYTTSYELKYLQGVSEPSDYISDSGYPVLVFLTQTS